MPVNTAALKTFAPAMRRQLLEAVGRKLDLLLNSQTPDTLSTYARQIAELREQEAENRDQLLERVAYTWFNRLCALRYLDARGWHPFGCKVLMPAGEGETQPELLKLMRAGSLPAELKPHTNEARLHGLLDGQIPAAIAGADPQGEVYRELVLASCRSYHQLLPDLFEGLDDASELLLPDDILSEGSIAHGFRSAISDEDCADVEIIGWLYQFYISEKKDQVIGKVVKNEDIPAATQLFTPNWIVKYMVQNSLGATWLATYPYSPLKGEMEFYIEPTEQIEQVNAQLAEITPERRDPEELTLIDPACGSGHILVEAYDLLKAIYLERGYRQRDIPELILTKNLYGLDICPRAVQLATFSLLMKGREDDRRLLERGIQLNVIALLNSAGLNVERIEASVDLSAAGLCSADVRMLAEQFTHATTLGSLIRVPVDLAERLPALSHLADTEKLDLFTEGTLHTLGALVRQAELLSRRYDSVVTNPPYMGLRAMSPTLKEFTPKSYPATKTDLFACFIERCLTLARSNGIASLVTMHSWMFLSSFQEFRSLLLRHKTIQTMAHLGTRAFGSISGEVVQTTAFSIRNKFLHQYKPVFFDLLDGDEISKEIALRHRDKRFDQTTQEELARIPGCSIAYWTSSAFRKVFELEGSISNYAEPRQGMATSDVGRFLRRWFEVDHSRTGFDFNSREAAQLSGLKWFPTNKGGGFRKWYGNNEFVVNWEGDGKEVLSYAAKLYGSPTRTIKNIQYYFRPSVTWNLISTNSLAARYSPGGYLFDVGGPSAFPEGKRIFQICGLFNSSVFQEIIKTINPTLNYNSGDIGKVPVNPDLLDSEQFASHARTCIEIHRLDWDEHEASWDFLSNKLLASDSEGCESLQKAFANYIERADCRVKSAREAEQANNEIFSEAYGVSEGAPSRLQDEQVTLTCNPAYRYGCDVSREQLQARFRRDTMAEFISYAAGCLMGRYSLDQPGLILADSRESQAAHIAAYDEKVGKPLDQLQFKPDVDAIIPVLDGEWFEDDIVARTREFLEVTFPESTVTENLLFIEESLGKDIRKYFCSEFYKDHLQTYKKRPIYWMVQSPKKGFACLIYLHRYTKDTLNQVLNNYFRPYLQKLEARLAQLGLDQLNDSLPTRERTVARKEAEKITKVLKECQAWEQEALLPLAQQRIELDLDDGVKVNYLKLQDVLAPIPGLAAKED